MVDNSNEIQWQEMFNLSRQIKAILSGKTRSYWFSGQQLLEKLEYAHLNKNRPLQTFANGHEYTEVLEPGQISQWPDAIKIGDFNSGTVVLGERLAHIQIV
jgi:hypothetical protein